LKRLQPTALSSFLLLGAASGLMVFQADAAPKAKRGKWLPLAPDLRAAIVL
jgi:hypothetical protein